MNIAFCSSEVVPFSKTGGLADVSGALPRALAQKGNIVKVFTPFYPGITPDREKGGYGISFLADNLEVIFIKNKSFFERKFLYGPPGGDYKDNLERFSFFNEQIIYLLNKINFTPNIVHCNDWQTALLPIYLKTKYRGRFSDAGVVFTIHNLAYQGIFSRRAASALNINQKYLKSDYLGYGKNINLIKGAIIFSDWVTTVSPTYAEEIKKTDKGFGLNSSLQQKGKKLSGIINGIDYGLWDPRHDRFISCRYKDDIITYKKNNKLELQKEVGLRQDSEQILIGMVSRLIFQKGIDKVMSVIKKVVSKSQLIILGRGPEKIEKKLIKLANKHGNLSVSMEFNEPLAHRIYAGCDFFLIPSKFEPCGLSQLMSYRYGTMPIAYKTGGLSDSVIDYGKGGGGIVFEKYTRRSLIKAIQRAKELFDDKKAFTGVLGEIMKYDFSWRKVADKYLEVYQRCLTAD